MNMLMLTLAVLTAGPNLPPSLDLGGSGTSVSPVVSLVAWDKGGSDSWGAGIPSPTIDCAAVGSSSSASLQCSGATPSFAGSAQTAAGSPWWYRGDTAVRPSIALNGSTDYWTLGGAGTHAATGNAAWVCAAFEAPSASGTYFIAAADEGTARTWFLDVDNGQVKLYAFKDSSSYTPIIGPALTPGAFYVVCAAYNGAGGDNAGTLNMNVNGVAVTQVTTARAPLATGATTLRIGAGASAGGKFPARVRRVALGYDVVTPAQLAQLVATQWGLAADKPAGSVATHARTDSTLCCPFSDAECYTVGPGGPCIHAPSYSGWAGTGPGIEVFGAGANALLYSSTFAHATWTKSAGVSASDADAACPLGPAGVRMSLVTTDGEADNIAQDAATTPGRSVWMARATGDSACGITFSDASGDGAQSVPLTGGPLRYWSGGTGQTGLSVARPAGGCARWCMQMAQGQAVTYPVPFRSTDTGTAYAGIASTATALTGTSALLSKDRWALGVTATPTGGWATPSLGLLQWGGSYGAANSVSVYTDAAAKLVAEIYDGSSGWRRWTADAAFSGTTPAQKKIGVASNAGTIRVLVDGAEVTGTMSGAGTGLLAALPSTSLVVGTVGSSILRGLDARVCQASDLAGLKRCLQ